jgi:hypothetical protein
MDGTLTANLDANSRFTRASGKRQARAESMRWIEALVQLDEVWMSCAVVATPTTSGHVEQPAG